MRHIGILRECAANLYHAQSAAKKAIDARDEYELEMAAKAAKSMSERILRELGK